MHISKGEWCPAVWLGVDADDFDKGMVQASLQLAGSISLTADAYKWARTYQM